MRYDLIIFDFDGTLADSLPWFFHRLEILADEFGFPRVTREAGERLRVLPPRKVLQELGIPLWKLPAIARQTQQLMTRERDQIKLFPGVPKLLSELAASGIQIGIVTSNNQLNVNSVLGDPSARLISYYRCGASIFGKRVKIRQVLKESRISADRTLCIGDELRDLDAARAEGIAFGAVDWGFTPPAAFRAHAPDLSFASIGEIAEKLIVNPASAQTA